jgi:hypoxanthine phosphoribosyltransferase
MKHFRQRWKRCATRNQSNFSVYPQPAREGKRAPQAQALALRRRTAAEFVPASGCPGAGAGRAEGMLGHFRGSAPAGLPQESFVRKRPLRLISRAVSELKVLISREQIAKRVAEMGAQITRDFAGESILFVGVLKGAAIFLSDLARQVQLDATFDFIGVSSYGNRPSPAQELQGGWDSTGEVRLTKDADQSMAGKNVILVEDILDTGLTLTYLRQLLLAHQPKTLRIAALLDKPTRRKQPIHGDYIGFSIPDEFVVGYGLDYAERYRNLPDICVVPRGDR